MKDAVGFNLAYYQQYGDVAKIYVVGKPTVMFYTPEAIEKFLYDKEDRFSTNKGYYKSDELFPDGLLFLDSQHHHFHRRIMQAAFTPQALTGYTSALNDTAKRFLDRYEQKSNIIFYPDVKNFLFTAAAHVFMGIYDNKEAEWIVGKYRELLAATITPFTRPCKLNCVTAHI